MGAGAHYRPVNVGVIKYHTGMMFRLCLSLICIVPSVYLSLGSTDYVVNNSQIDIKSIGESHDQVLVCHTNSTACCRGQDDPSTVTGSGEWLFPNGAAVIPIQHVTELDTDLFYRSRHQQLIRLHRRGDVSMPTGSYCCLIPVATRGEMTFCLDLGI